MSIYAQLNSTRLPSAPIAGWPRGIVFFARTVNKPEASDRDSELLRQIAAGDRLAFAEFYDRHSPLMFSVAAKILNDPGEAEDVLQETFVQIWEKAARFNPRLGKAASWAAILTRNRAIDKVRASQRRSRLAEASGREQSGAQTWHDTVNDALYGPDKAKLIQSAIQELPPEQRRAIDLAYFSGLTQEEIAQKLNTPLGTIKARIRRGLLKLRDQLESRL